MNGWLPSGCCTLLLATICAGCATPQLDWSQAKPDWKWPGGNQVFESQYGHPARLAAIWTPDVITVPGKPAVRGFGGRLYFYDNQNRTVPVEGQLVVYGYDDSQPTRSQKKPDRRFGFTPDQFTGHFSETDLGASYSIWIPWDAAGSPQKKISLLPVFTSATGARVVGAQTINVLPGPPAEGQPESPPMPPQPVALRQVSYQSAAKPWSEPPHSAADLRQAGHPEPTRDADDSAQRNIKTTTIHMPRSLSMKMAAGALPPAVSSQATLTPEARMLLEQQYIQNQRSPATAPTANGSVNPDANRNSGPFGRPVSWPRRLRSDSPTAHSGSATPQAPGATAAPPTAAPPQWPPHPAAHTPHPPSAPVFGPPR